MGRQLLGSTTRSDDGALLGWPRRLRWISAPNLCCRGQHPTKSRSTGVELCIGGIDAAGRLGLPGRHVNAITTQIQTPSRSHTTGLDTRTPSHHHRMPSSLEGRARGGKGEKGHTTRMTTAHYRASRPLLVAGLLGCLLCLALLPQPAGAFLARPPMPTLHNGLRAPRCVSFGVNIDGAMWITTYGPAPARFCLLSCGLACAQVAS